MAEGDTLQIVAGHQVLSPTTVISSTDPGAIGAGNLWLDTAADTGGLYPLFVRDPTNAFWYQASIGDILSTDPQSPYMAFDNVDGDGNVLARFRLASAGGSPNALIETNSALGDAPRGTFAETPTQTTMTHSESGGTTAQVIWDATGLTFVGNLGFNTFPVARPEVPAIPTPQDVVDALVLLGLVTQAA